MSHHSRSTRLPPNAFTKTRPNKHHKKRHSKPPTKPKPNRNLRRSRRTKTPSRSQHTHSRSMDDQFIEQTQTQTNHPPNPCLHDSNPHQLDAPPQLISVHVAEDIGKPIKLSMDNSHKNGRTHYKRSPNVSSVTRESKHRKRSHSFSVSRTYSNVNTSRGHSRKLPTHYSPSITHYSPSHQAYTDSPQITPPPQPLPPSMILLNTNGNTPSQRKRSRSLSRKTESTTNRESEKSAHHKEENRNGMDPAVGFNIAHILKLSASEDSNDDNELDTKEQTETQTAESHDNAHAKSTLFSSWFTASSLFWDTQNKSEPERSRDDNTDNGMPKMGVLEETKSNVSFTTGLKPPRKYTTDRECDENDTGPHAQEEKISFRDFLAQENRKALQREVVAEQNLQTEPLRCERDLFALTANGGLNGKLRPNPERFSISKGSTVKVDYGLPEGPYTLYKFIITYNHEYQRPCKQRSCNDIYDESPRRKTSHWSIKKRYSDFVTFNNNLIAEIKGMNLTRDKTIKLPRLPPKTFKKSFSPSFVSARHDALLAFLSKVINIAELQSSVTLLTFLGAVNNHSLGSDKFLESRMTVSVYVSNYADTGDVILFETKSYMAASLRSVTASNYDHVGLVYRDIDGTHQCAEEMKENEEKKKQNQLGFNYQGNDNLNGLYLVESTMDGVRTYPLKKRLKQWSVLCPQIVVRRLKMLKPGVQQQKTEEWKSASLNNLMVAGNMKSKINAMYSKYDYAMKTDAFYVKASEFVNKVNGLDYAIWTNVFRLNDVPFEKQKSFFCSQLVTAFFKYMDLLPHNVKTNRILPGHFGDDETNEVKLPLQNCLLTEEHLLLFKMPAISAARHQHQRRQ